MRIIVKDATAPGGPREDNDRAAHTNSADEQVEHRPARAKQLVPRGKRPITFVRRFTSSSDRSGRFVERSRLPAPCPLGLRLLCRRQRHVPDVDELDPASRSPRQPQPRRGDVEPPRQRTSQRRVGAPASRGLVDPYMNLAPVPFEARPSGARMSRNSDQHRSFRSAPARDPGPAGRGVHFTDGRMQRFAPRAALDTGRCLWQVGDLTPIAHAIACMVNPCSVSSHVRIAFTLD